MSIVPRLGSHAHRWITGSLVLLLGLVALGWPTPTPAQGTTIVVPNANAAVEGNSNDGGAFTIGLAGPGPFSIRYQQLFAASQFAAVSGPHLITQIAFRPDATDPLFSLSTTLPNIQINLSTTSQVPDGLSATFASNVGVDNTVVFSGPLSLSSAFAGPVGGPKEFDWVIPLTTPFTYNPANGNLLLDLRNFEGATLVLKQLDAQLTTGDPVSRAVAFTSSGGANATTASAVDSNGLIAQFTLQGIATPTLTSTPPPTSTPGPLVSLCHRTGSVQSPLGFITVARSALAAHLAHGDFIANAPADCQSSP